MVQASALVSRSFTMSLSADLEADPQIRSRGRQNARITIWPSLEATGVPSVKACALNTRPLEILATWWVSMTDVPSSIPVDLVRNEAWPPKSRTPTGYPIFIP